MNVFRFGVPKGVVRFICILAVSLACFAGSQEAIAQRINAPSPEAIAVTPGGVDIRTGRYAYEKTDISIGAESGGIAMQRIMAASVKGHVNPFGNLSHNWDITLVVRPKLAVPELGNNDQLANVSYGGRSQTFERLDSPEGHDMAFRQKSQNDFTRLTTPGTAGAPGAVYTFQATDGTIANFRPTAVGECVDASIAGECAFVANVIEPDGTRYDFEYESTAAPVQNRTRLRSVASSRGFALLFEYGADWNLVTKACAFNMAEIAKPANNICPAGGIAANYTYSGSRIASVTRPDTTVESYTYTPTGANGAYAMAFKKPGQTAPWQTINFEYDLTADGTLQPIVRSQLFADGSSFTYGYDYTPAVTSSQPSYSSIAGGAYVNALGHLTEVRYAFPLSITTFTGSSTPVNVGEGGLGTANNYDTYAVQITPGPAQIINAMGEPVLIDYCDPNAMANLPSYIYNRCYVMHKQSSRHPEGNLVKYKYGYNNNLAEVRQVAKPGSGLPDLVQSASYDSAACLAYLKTCDKPLSITDAKGLVTEFTWHTASGKVLTETRSAPAPGGLRPQKRYSYVQAHAWYKNSVGTMVQSPHPVWLLSQTSECRTGAAPACLGTADETRSTYSYGPAGTADALLPVSITVAAGDGSVEPVTTTFGYDTVGNKLTEDGPLAGADDVTRWRYDAMHRVVGVIRPDPEGAAGALKFRATRSSYDPAGRLVKVEQGTVDSQSDADWALFAPMVTTETQYDQLDRKIRVWSYGTTGGTQQLSQYSYDLAGNLECTAVRMNPATYTSLPASACTLAGEGPDGPDRITRLSYDAAGRLLKTTVAYGTALQTDQETNTWTANGKLATVTDAENNRTTFEYDGHDRLKKTRYPVTTVGANASSATDYEELNYDANGNVTQHRKRDGQLVNFGYDDLDRVVFKDLPNLVAGEYDVTTAYDNLDRPVLVTDTAGNSVGAGYNALGQLVSQSSPSGTFALAYDEAGRLKRIVHPDGNFFTYSYNTADLTGIRQNGTLSLVSYGYDNLGRRTAITRGNGTVSTYGYDSAGRVNCLTQNLTGGGTLACTPTPTASGADQATTFSHLPSGQIKGLTRANDSYAWTAHYNVNRDYGTNGLNQLTSAGSNALGYDGRGNLTSSGSDVYSYTAENRLATGPGGAVLFYDPTGRLSRLTKGTSTTRFDHLGPRLVIERDAAGTILRRYVHGPGDDEPVVWYEGASLSNKRWLHTDERGSVVAISDASGASIATNRYDEYGIPQGSNAGRFQYTGQAWVAELGLYYYKARFYSPTLGRFMQTDPIGYGDGTNWYAYVGNDPVNRADPDGTYGRGSGFSDAQWKKFDAAQKTAAKDMERRADKLDRKAGKLDAKGRAGGDALRQKSGYLRQGASDLRSNGADGKIAVGVTAAKYASEGGSPNGAARVAPGQNLVVTVNIEHSSWSDSRQAPWNVGHESLHSGAGLEDQKGPNGWRAYKHSDDPRHTQSFRDLVGTSKANNNPDHLMDEVY